MSKEKFMGDILEEANESDLLDFWARGVGSSAASPLTGYSDGVARQRVGKVPPSPRPISASLRG